MLWRRYWLIFTPNFMRLDFVVGPCFSSEGASNFKFLEGLIHVTIIVFKFLLGILFSIICLVRCDGDDPPEQHALTKVLCNTYSFDTPLNEYKVEHHLHSCPCRAFVKTCDTNTINKKGRSHSCCCGWGGIAKSWAIRVKDESALVNYSMALIKWHFRDLHLGNQIITIIIITWRLWHKLNFCGNSWSHSGASFSGCRPTRWRHAECGCFGLLVCLSVGGSGLPAMGVDGHW